MDLRTCLLVTDDPDDHQAFSEAIAEITPAIVLVVVSDAGKALQMLKTKKCVPDYIFLDLTVHELKSEEFLKGLVNDNTLNTIPMVVYGEESGFFQTSNINTTAFFVKDYDYSELKDFLTKIFVR
jgi:CheY-like chemotaxis protein